MQGLPDHRAKDLADALPRSRDSSMRSLAHWEGSSRLISTMSSWRELPAFEAAASHIGAGKLTRRAHGHEKTSSNSVPCPGFCGLEPHLGKSCAEGSGSEEDRDQDDGDEPDGDRDHGELEEPGGIIPARAGGCGACLARGRRADDGGDRGQGGLVRGATDGSASPRSRRRRRRGCSGRRRRRGGGRPRRVPGAGGGSCGRRRPRRRGWRGPGGVGPAGQVGAQLGAVLVAVGRASWSSACGRSRRTPRGRRGPPTPAARGSSIRCLKILLTMSPPSNGGRPARAK